MQRGLECKAIANYGAPVGRGEVFLGLLNRRSSSPPRELYWVKKPGFVKQYLRQNTLTLEEWGYTNKAHLRGL